MKEKAKRVADLVLQSGKLEMGYKRDSIELFIGELQGERLLFLMELSRKKSRVAMNYGHLWQKKNTRLESINTIIAIPDLNQMEKFLKAIEDLDPSLIREILEI